MRPESAPSWVSGMPGRRSIRFVGSMAVCVVLAGLILPPAPVAAIYYGTPDFGHANVGAILDDDPVLGVVFLFCSGTLIAERIFLTAGHCTTPLAKYMAAGDTIWVGFDQNVFANPKSWYRVVALHTDPQFTLTSGDYHDLGVAILDRRVNGATPAVLAPPGFLDELASRDQLRGSNFTTVGFGVTEIFGEYGLRKMALSRFLSLRDVGLHLGQNLHTGYGGTCGGDSGGPAFFETGRQELLVATTSRGDASCLGESFFYRIDTPGAAAFLASVFTLYS